jgi:hypothetical protein
MSDAMPPSPAPPLTDAELGALEASYGAIADRDATAAKIVRALAEVRAAREAAKRHDLEARRRIAELESMLGPRS